MNALNFDFSGHITNLAWNGYYRADDNYKRKVVSMHVLFIGIIISLLITETTGFSPGGIIVAGYLTLFFSHPVWLAGTIIAALATYFLVRLVSIKLLVYGRRQFAVCILVGMLVGQSAMVFLRGMALYDWGLVVIGYVIPGLIARDFIRQGIGSTLLVLALSVLLTKLMELAGSGWLW